MTTYAFRGGCTLALSNEDSPITFSTIEEVKTMSGLGKTNSLLNATHFGSGNTMEYIAGMADGDEISVTCQRVHDSPSIQDRILAAVDAGQTKTFKFTHTDGTTAKTYTFSAVCLKWGSLPSQEEINQITFALKISGEITVA